MKTGIYSVFDVKAGAYMVPFFLATDAMALRGFSDLLLDAEHPFSAHAEDFTLFKVGEFTDVKGVVIGCTPLSLGNGVELVAARRIDSEKVRALHEQIEAIKANGGEPNVDQLPLLGDA